MHGLPVTIDETIKIELRRFISLKLSFSKFLTSTQFSVQVRVD